MTLFGSFFRLIWPCLLLSFALIALPWHSEMELATVLVMAVGLAWLIAASIGIAARSRQPAPMPAPPAP